MRVGRWEVLEELGDGVFHARSEAGLEVRLTRRNSSDPPSPVSEPHPHVAQVLEASDELVVSAWVPGVSLRGLLQRAQQRGLATLPASLAVGLVQQLCRGLAHAHAHQLAVPGEVNLESAMMGFDGRLRATAFGAPTLDVPAAALLLDQLLGERLDAELTRVIGEARQRMARGITTALALEQRLGHWQVKQLQLFPGHDLVAEFVGWLFPEHAQSPASAEVSAWLDGERDGPVAPAPSARPAGPSRKTAALLGAAGLVLLISAAVGIDLAQGDGRPKAPPLLRQRPPPMVPAVRPSAASAEPVAVPVSAPTLPRRGQGVPAEVQLSSKVHGIALETAGFGVSAPAPRWAAKTVALASGQPAPRYASLFAAEFDAKEQLVRLTQVGTSWAALSQPRARFFVTQTDRAAGDGEGSFGLAFGTPGPRGVAEAPKLRRPDVLTDLMTDIEPRRFLLGGLDPKKSYVVSLRRNAQGATPFVVAMATIPTATEHVWSTPGFQQPGPIDQVLLQPAAAVTVQGASRLSFVVLTTRDSPEGLAVIDVSLPVAISRGKGPRQVLPPGTPLTAQVLLSDGKALMKRGDYAGASVLFEECVELEPTQVECRELLGLVAQKRRAR